MKYIRVEWKHSSQDYPMLLYSEVDEAGWELRKIEVFRDGTHGYADATEECGGTRLGLETVPALTIIGADPQFEPEEISKHQFERMWCSRKTRSTGPSSP